MLDVLLRNGTRRLPLSPTSATDRSYNLLFTLAADGNGKSATLLDGSHNNHHGHATTWDPSVSEIHRVGPAPPADEPVLAILKHVADGSLQPVEAATLIQQQAMGSQQVSQGASNLAKVS